LLVEHPELDRQHVRQLIRTAHKEAANAKPPKAARELFRYLREVIAD
jgi:ribosome-associated protein